MVKLKRLLVLLTVGLAIQPITSLINTSNHESYQKQSDLITNNLLTTMEPLLLNNGSILENNINYFGKNYVSKMLAQDYYERLLEKTDWERQEKWNQMQLQYEEEFYDEKMETLGNDVFIKNLSRLPRGLTSSYFNSFYIPHKILVIAEQLLNKPFYEGMKLMNELSLILNKNLVLFINKQETNVLKNYFVNKIDEILLTNDIGLPNGNISLDFWNIFKIKKYNEFEEMFIYQELWEKNNSKKWEYKEAKKFLLSESNELLAGLTDSYFNNEFLHFWLLKSQLQLKILDLNHDNDYYLMEEIFNQFNQYLNKKVINEENKLWISNLKDYMLTKLDEDLLINIEEDIIDDNLGTFDYVPTKEDIYYQIEILNPNLQINELEIIAIQNGTVKAKVINQSNIYHPEIVEFYYNIDLNSILPHYLGVFSHPPTNEQLFERIKHLKPDVEIELLEIKSHTSGKITIKSISKLYDNQESNLTYTINLANLLKEDNLGSFDHYPTEQEIIDRIKEKNPEIDSNEFPKVILEQTYNSGWDVAGNEIYTIPLWRMFDSNLYWSAWWTNFSFYYIVKNLKSLENDLVNVDLGEFDKMPSEENILNSIKELNPNVNINQIKIVSNNENNSNIRTAFVQVIDNSSVYWKNCFEITYLIKGMKDLSEDLRVTDLGEFDKTPTEQEIFNKIKELNSNIDINQIKINKMQIGYPGFAEIIVLDKSNIYFQKGLLSISFKVKGVKKLSEDLTIIDLRNFDHYPTEEQILKRIKDLNPKLNMSQIKFKWKKGNYDQKRVALIQAINNSSIYSGSFELFFKVTSLKKLNDSFPIKTLGEFDYNPTNEDILIRIQELYPNIDITQIEVLNMELKNSRGKEITAFVQVIDNSSVYWQKSIEYNLVELTFTLKNIRLLLDDLSNRNLGEFNHEPTSQELLERIKVLNPNIDISQIEIVGQNKDFILARWNSSVYLNPKEVDIYYTVKLPISK